MSKSMITSTVVLGDAMLDMSHAAQALFMVLLVLTDDDGVVQGHKQALRLLGTDEERFKELCDSGLVLAFDDGAVCITDWLVMNRLESRYYKIKAPAVYRDAIRVQVDGRYTLRADGNLMTIDEYRKMISEKTRSVTQDAKPKARPAEMKKTESKAPTEVNGCFGKYENVELTESQIDDLVKLCGDSAYGYVHRLSEYMERTGDVQLDAYNAIKILAGNDGNEFDAKWSDRQISNKLHGSYTDALMQVN